MRCIPNVFKYFKNFNYITAIEFSHLMLTVQCLICDIHEHASSMSHDINMRFQSTLILLIYKSNMATSCSNICYCDSLRLRKLIMRAMQAPTKSNVTFNFSNVLNVLFVSMACNLRQLTDIERRQFTNASKVFNALLAYCGENIIAEAAYRSN